MWRWWGGVVTAVDGATATVERHVTQRQQGDPRTAGVEVHAPADLDVAVGDRVWFGSDGDRKVVVAAGSPEAAVTRLPDVAQVLR